MIKRQDIIRKAIDEDNTSIHEEGYKVVEERTLKKVGKQLKDEYTELLNKK